MKRPEIWLGIALAACLLALAFHKWLAPRTNGSSVPQEGRWHESREGGARVLTPEEQEAAERVLALPYLQGSRPAPAASRVTLLEEDRVHPGLNLYNSGHAPEAFLMDMKGQLLHRWMFPIDDLWPDALGPIQSTYWRRVHLFPNGELLAIFEGIGMIKVDRRSNLLWSFRGRSHHQAHVAEDGKILVLTRRARIIPRINPDKPVLEDFVAVLDSEGRLMEEFSLLEAFEKSEYASILEDMPREGDIFHTNTLYILDGSQVARSPVFKRGNLLISVLFLDAVAIVDPEIKRVVWAVSGQKKQLWSRQHDPRLLADGSMLLYDNQGRQGRSKVIEFDPFTLKIHWSFPDRSEDDFYSETCGASQRLPNGNTLITESDNGRAFEVTREQDVVWEFYNPHRAGKNQELIATLFEVQRIEAGALKWQPGS